MVGAASRERVSSGCGVAAIFVLLLSLFAAAPTSAAAKAYAPNAALIADAEAPTGSTVTCAYKKAKPSDLLSLLGSSSTVVTRLLYVYPASSAAAQSTGRGTVALRAHYNARAPPAPLI